MPSPIPFHAVKNLSGRSLFSIALPVMILLCCSLSSWAQSPSLQIGQVQFEGPGNCTTGESGSHPLPGATCYKATVHGCPAYGTDPFRPITDDLPPVSAIVAVLTPTPVVNWNGGTIVLFSGGDGEDYYNEGLPGTSYALDYSSQHFQVVQVAWGLPNDTWRDNNDNPPVKVMKYEGCRPATLLKFLSTSDKVHALPGGAGPGGMCTQGHSTGATAIAFALAWYGADSYLDNVVLTSGPAQANIEAGCQYPYSQQFQHGIGVCTAGKCVGGVASWTDCTQYANGGHGVPTIDCDGNLFDSKNAAKSVAEYTNSTPGNCNDYQGTHVNTGAFDQDWHGMSVVSGSPDYDYSPKTSVYAFLCASGHDPLVDLPNNSAAQAWLYLSQILNARNQLTGFYRVDGCTGDEKIYGPYATTSGGSGFDVSANAMINGCPKTAIGH